MTIWLVLTTPLRFVLAFSAEPNRTDRGWRGRHRVALDPASTELLRFDEVLVPDVPQAFGLVPDGESRWHLVRWGSSNYVSVLRDMQPKVTFCHTGTAILGMGAFPIGMPVALVKQGI